MSASERDQRWRVVIPDDITGKYASNNDIVAPLRAIADVAIYGTKPTPDELAERIRDADIVLSFRPAFTSFPREIIQQCSRLRYISISGAGVEDVDVAYASSRGIAVGNNVKGSRYAVAEACLAMIFDVGRRITEQDRAIRSGQWLSLQGVELAGKTVGLVGLSGIARELAPLAKSVGLNVLSWSRDNSPERAASVGAIATELGELLQHADFVSLHLRLFPELRGFMNRERFAQMKDGAFLINTARGELIDEACLVEALENGRLRGAALDVFPQTPLPDDHPLRRFPNVVLTPTSAANTQESLHRGLTASIDNVLAFIAGSPTNITNIANLKRD